MNDGAVKTKGVKFSVIDLNGKGITEGLLKLIIIEKINSSGYPLNKK